MWAEVCEVGQARPCGAKAGLERAVRAWEKMGRRKGRAEWAAEWARAEQATWRRKEGRGGTARPVLGLG